MQNISKYRKRFYMLMESDLGDVKPISDEGKKPEEKYRFGHEYSNQYYDDPGNVKGRESLQAGMRDEIDLDEFNDYDDEIRFGKDDYEKFMFFIKNTFGDDDYRYHLLKSPNVYKYYTKDSDIIIRRKKRF